MSVVAGEKALSPGTVGSAREATAEVLRAKEVVDPERWGDTLVAAVLGVPHRELTVRSDQSLTKAQAERLRELTAQVTPDAPVAYLVGQAPFLGLDFEVTRDTLICKPDTELFVRLVLAQIAQDPLPPAPHVLELCTGSGCVAVTFALALPDARVVATDISPEALAVAECNVDRCGLTDRVVLGQGDLFAPVAALADGRPFDLIVSNPPYIPTNRITGMGRHVAEHEPHLALDGGEDGLDPHRRILAEAGDFLAPGGYLFLEHEYYQGAAARELARRHSCYEDVRTFQDARGRDRAVFCRKKDSGELKESRPM